MKKYHLIHVEDNVTPLTLSINLHAMDHPWLRKLMHGHDVGRYPFCAYWGHGMKFYVDKDRWFATSRYIVNQVEQKSRLTAQVHDQSLVVGQEILRVLHDPDNYDITKITVAKLIKILRHLFQKAVELCALGYVPALSDFGTFYFSDKLQAIMQAQASTCHKYHASPAAVLSLLTTPAELYPSDQAKLELQKNLKHDQAIVQWLARWFWVSYGHLGPGWTKASVKRELKHLTGLNIKAAKQAVKKQQALWFKRLRLAPADKHIILTGQDFVYIKGYRQELLFGVYAWLRRVAALAGARHKLPPELMDYVNLEELIALLQGKKVVTPSLLKQRQRICLAVPQNLWQSQVYAGQAAEQYLKTHATAEEKLVDKNISTITGQVAYPGQVRGRVLIINSRADMNKVKGPFILVSQQTNPELLPVMKKAKAFVTDHGGITSHASIVAREMKKPCVIGTKIATQILQDGDWVEVDAENGNVRKL